MLSDPHNYTLPNNIEEEVPPTLEEGEDFEDDIYSVDLSSETGKEIISL